MTTKKAPIVESSGNVFEDIGFSHEEARLHLLKSELMLKIGRRLEARGLTQHAASKVLGISQPRVSDLVNGKVSQFSIDMLFTLAARAGLEVSVDARDRETNQSPTSTLTAARFYRVWDEVGFVSPRLDQTVLYQATPKKLKSAFLQSMPTMDVGAGSSQTGRRLVHG